ncbi:M61 family metallopeptidase [Scleromatobacter humisilvae]|uniref:PDZ domain-containing protein n=1 Tax=Scleromatobacter humisilvae TaxID=2897159 RepID=A0A9X1YMV3_9BURK|nr:PDZ domain-containing protein [Scleromatobacter humisilvae]MCK9688380.1 PDZ domain-containing protein [Scleromatobacter humisilvae]
MIHYRIEVADLATHQFKVTLTIADPAPRQQLSLPAWIPGSYMIREFARHLSRLEARQGSQPRPLVQLAKDRWSVETSGRGALVVTYFAYAFDPSVRTAWLSDDRGFFNTTSLCLAVEGRTDEPHRVELARLPAGWDVATAMARVDAAAKGAKSKPARTQVFESADYDELADHPFELGPFWRGSFTSGGVVHEFVVSGAWPQFDGARLLADTKRICDEEIRFWHGGDKPPFARYVFMLYATEDGYGGLEHRASTALIAARKDLPRLGVAGTSDGYVTLLGLISHEYFHTWNVKRLKPAEFLPYDFSQENYTELLWFFEGFTSYYDDLFLLRAGLIDPARYVKLVGRAMNGVRQAPGQHVQSVAEASFDAWVKYYRTDENTPNSTISYYTKGSLVALRLDLALRAGGKATLDDVMRALWRDAPGGGVTEELILKTVARLGGKAVAAELRDWVHQRGELDVLPALARVGVEPEVETLTLAFELGIRVAEGPVTGIQVKHVLAGGAGAAAGLSAGDEILAVDGWRVRRLDDALSWIRTGAAFELLVVRQQRVRTLRVADRLSERRNDAASRSLKLSASPNAATLARRNGWLGK